MKKAKVLSLALLAAPLFACGGGSGGGNGGGNVGGGGWNPPSISFKSIYNELTENGTKNTLCLTLGSDESYLSFDTNPLNLDDYYSATYSDVAHEAVKKCGFTEATWDAMLHTRALDGAQTDQTSKVKARWTYHPNKGLECTFSYLS